MKRTIKSFIIAGIIYMFLGVLFGGLISGGPVADYAQTEAGHWLEAEHALINFIGFLSLILMGLTYQVVPSICEKQIYSKKLGNLNFVIVNLGLLFMIIFIALKSLLGIEYFSSIIMIGGILLTIGYFTFGINILKSL